MKIIYLSIIIGLLYSCQNSNNDKQEISHTNKIGLYDDHIFMSPEFDSLLTKFISINKLEKINGNIYIDRTNPLSSTIILANGYIDEPYNQAQKEHSTPLFYVKKEGCTFNIYIGVEDVLEIGSSADFVKTKSKCSVWWILRHYDNTFHVATKNIVAPFEPITISNDSL